MACMRSLSWVYLVLVAQGSIAAQEAPTAETVLRGVESRLAAISSLTGTALVAWTYSPWRNEEDSERLMQAAIENDREPVPCDPVHASLLDFSIDLDRGQWRCEMVDLTNSGHRNWATSQRALEHRDYPPECSFRVSVSNGERIYTYDRGTRAGWVRDCTAPGQPTAVPVSWVRNHVLRGFPLPLEDLRDGEYVVTYAGEKEVDAKRCLGIAMRRSDERSSVWRRAWVAPDLGFATVRHETVNCQPSDSPRQRPSLLGAQVYRAGDFAQVAEGVWCPQMVHIDHFDYSHGEGEDAWEYSFTIQSFRLSANTGAEGIVTPYPFPFDTEIYDESMQPIRPRPQHPGLKGAPPDVFGLELTPEQVLRLPGRESR